MKIKSCFVLLSLISYMGLFGYQQSVEAKGNSEYGKQIAQLKKEIELNKSVVDSFKELTKQYKQSHDDFTRYYSNVGNDISKLTLLVTSIAVIFGIINILVLVYGYFAKRSLDEEIEQYQGKYEKEYPEFKKKIEDIISKTEKSIEEKIKQMDKTISEAEEQKDTFATKIKSLREELVENVKEFKEKVRITSSSILDGVLLLIVKLNSDGNNDVDLQKKWMALAYRIEILPIYDVKKRIQGFNGLGYYGDANDIDEVKKYRDDKKEDAEIRIASQKAIDTYEKRKK